MATDRTRHNAPPDLSVRGVSLCFPNAPTLLQPEPPQPRKLEGGAAKVQPSYGIQYVDLNAFYPPKSKAPISTEIDSDACPGWRQPDPPAVNREVLADGSRRQRCGHFRDGTHDRRHKRVRIGSRPRTSRLCSDTENFEQPRGFGGSSAQPPDRPQQTRLLACARTIGHLERSGLSKSVYPKPCSRTDCMRWHPLPSQRSSCGWRQFHATAPYGRKRCGRPLQGPVPPAATIRRLTGLPSSSSRPGHPSKRESPRQRPESERR
jgi:hypothetical protein